MGLSLSMLSTERQAAECTPEKIEGSGFKRGSARKAKSPSSTKSTRILSTTIPLASMRERLRRKSEKFWGLSRDTSHPS
jgi:hypothetical protein